ncbi:MAG TPA: GH32 C-terminal domain-containing protein, partial [Mucilaginibacter sp.]|nr:GH32 C-terminal domain-containing protein [Mucilaginibacter sp.]
FDGKTFTTDQVDTRWLDNGTDEYAGVTWHNTGSRRLFLGWMSNWEYATTVPTKTWRSAMTVPRELKLVKTDARYFVTAVPAKELESLKTTTVTLNNLIIKRDKDLTRLVKRSDAQYELKLSSKVLKSFSITLSNTTGEHLIIGYDEADKSWYIDRTKAGVSDFNKDFAKRIATKRIATTQGADLTLIVDAASVELFADKGLTVMTSIFFPAKPYDKIVLSCPDNFTADNIIYAPLKSIWH